MQTYAAAPPGAPIALANQGSTQLDALLVDSTGAVAVRWAVGLGAWNGPVRLTSAGYAPAGAPVALANQGSTQLDALLVTKAGAVNVLWAVGLGPWSGPARLA